MSGDPAPRTTPTAELDVAAPGSGPSESGDVSGGLGDLGPLPGRPRRKRLGPLTYLLAAAVIACGAFYAGARLEGSSGTSTSAGGLAAAFASRLGASGAKSAGGFSFPGGAAKFSSAGARPSGGVSGFGTAVTGTVKLVTGKDFYVAESTGTIVKVATGAGTAISVSSTGSVSDLHPGDRVTVVGKKKSGTVSATSVSDSGSTGASSPSSAP
jgi:hypothetical protein